MTKTDIKKEFQSMEKHGALVYTLNSYRAMPRGMRGLPDHIIIAGKDIYFIEVKLPGDRLRKEQIEFREAINGADGVFYSECTGVKDVGVIRNMIYNSLGD